MRLDRNINGNGDGKYGVINVRRLREFQKQVSEAPMIQRELAAAIKTLESAGILEWTQRGTPGEFFLIRLKDKYAGDALAAYAVAAHADDPEYAEDIVEMASRAGANSPWCRAPD